MRIARVFFDVHMGLNFRGLTEILRKAGCNPDMEDRSFIVFLNSAQTKFKLLVGKKYLVYHDNGKRKISLDAIKFLPEAFNGDQFNFDRAVLRSLQKKFNLNLRQEAM